MERMPGGAELKPWGWALHLGTDRDRINGGLELRAISRRSLACIRVGGYSSIHRHDWQANAFHVLEGTLAVMEFDLALGLPLLVNQHLLYTGDSVVIQAGKLHKFLAMTDCRLLEVYVATAGHEAKAEDIIRFTENGCDESLVLQHA